MVEYKTHGCQVKVLHVDGVVVLAETLAAGEGEGSTGRFGREVGEGDHAFSEGLRASGVEHLAVFQTS